MFLLLFAVLLSEPISESPAVKDRVITTCPIAIFRTFHQGVFSFSLDFRVKGGDRGVETVDFPFPELVSLFVDEQQLRECIESWQNPKGEVLNFTWHFGTELGDYLQWCDETGHCTKVKTAMRLYNTKEAIPENILKKYLEDTEL